MANAHNTQTSVIFAKLKPKKMKKNIIVALLCLMVQTGYAQKMRDVFVSMPDSVMPYLTKER